MKENEKLQEKIGEILAGAVASGEVAGANALVLQDGHVVAYGEGGYRDVEAGEAFSRDTIFRLYSMSKPITSAAVMILLERGLIDLGDPVSRYLPEFADVKVCEKVPQRACQANILPAEPERLSEESESIGAKEHTVKQANDMKEVWRTPKYPMMLRDLMNMTSGLPYPGEAAVPERGVTEVFRRMDEKLDTDQAYTTRQIAGMLAGQGLLFDPGEHFRYGTSADILGAIVEVVSGKSFSDFLREELFEPLKMADTGFYVPEEKQERFSKVYRCVNGTVTEERTRNLGISYEMKREPAFASGGAGMVSTLDDYAQFAEMLMKGGVYEGRRILSEAAVSFMTSGKLLPGPQQDVIRDWKSLPGFTYGNLLRVMETPGQYLGLGVKGEYGWDGWLGAYFANDPVHKITILMGMQKIDAGTWALTRKVRNAAFSELI